MKPGTSASYLIILDEVKGDGCFCLLLKRCKNYTSRNMLIGLGVVKFESFYLIGLFYMACKSLFIISCFSNLLVEQ